MQRFALSRLRIAVLALAVLGLGQAGCVQEQGCTEDQAKNSIVSIFEALYFFNDEVAQAAKYVGLDLDAYGDMDALLAHLRHEPDTFDRGFTYVTTPGAEAQFLSAGTYVGFGFMLDDRNENQLHVREVFAPSPAETAGLGRGDQVLEIDGRSIAEIEANEGVNAALGPSVQGLMRTFLIRPVSGEADFSVDVAKDIVAIEAVPLHDIFDVEGEKVGYLVFHSFIESSVPGLVAAFEDFQTAGLTRLVIDLRYNGGGLLNLAATVNDILGSWADDVPLGGPGNVGKIQYSARFNSDNSGLEYDDVFFQDDLALPLDTIVFITTEETASASELLINALAPYRDVYVVGARTFGKPVGQVARDFCGGNLRLRLVAFDLVNAEGEGEYFNGLPVDCSATDDLAEPLGSEAEASLAAALTVATTGLCPAEPMAGQAARAAQAGRRTTTLGPGAVPWLSAF